MYVLVLVPASITWTSSQFLTPNPSHLFSLYTVVTCREVGGSVFDMILFIHAGKEVMHKISDEFEFQPDRTTDYGELLLRSKKFPRHIMGKWCRHASSFIFD